VNVTDLASFAGAVPANPEPTRRHVGDPDNILPPRRRRGDRVGSAGSVSPGTESMTDLTSFTGESPSGPEADVHEVARNDSALELGRLHESSPAAEPTSAVGSSRWERASDNILPGRRANFRLLRR
jgi:hypothetical protein